MKTSFKSIFFVITFIPLFLFTYVSQADVYYVDDATGNDMWPGSAESPFATIQQAADSASASGDEIRVSGGTYTGTTSVVAIYDTFSGETETYYQIVFIGNKSLTLRGGYHISDWAVSDPELNITTIDAGGSGRGITIMSTSGETVTVDGFTITGGDYSDFGNADGEGGTECSRTSSDCGGGLYAYNVKLILKNSIIAGNTASTTRNYSDGGGVYLFSTRPGSQLDNISFSNNTATALGSQGGGLNIVLTSDVTIRNSDFTENYSQDGGGIFMFQPSGTITIRDVNFSGNTSYYNGGAISAKLAYTGETALYINRSIMDNNESWYGAGISLLKQGTDTSNAFLNNLIMINNTSIIGGGENSLIFIDSNSGMNVSINHLTASGNSTTSFIYAFSDGAAGETTTAHVNNTIIDAFTYAFSAEENSGGDVIFTYDATIFNDVPDVTQNFGGSPTFTPGGSLIFQDPLLDAAYHLRPGSPAINAGTDTGLLTDIDGDERPNGSGYDIGADEFYTKSLAGVLFLLLN